MNGFFTTLAARVLAEENFPKRVTAGPGFRSRAGVLYQSFERRYLAKQVTKAYLGLRFAGLRLANVGGGAFVFLDRDA
jgi:hypothetical protein